MVEANGCRGWIPDQVGDDEVGVAGVAAMEWQRRGALAIDLAAIADRDDENNQLVVFDAAEDTQVADAVTPDTFEWPLQRTAEPSGIVENQNTLVEKADDPSTLPLRELAHFLLRLGVELKRPGQRQRLSLHRPRIRP